MNQLHGCFLHESLPTLEYTRPFMDESTRSGIAPIRGRMKSAATG